MLDKKMVLSLGVVVFAAAITSFIYLGYSDKQLESVESVKNHVGKHYLLPDEEPALATVEDRSKLKSEFLESAENGDKLLIYKNAKKVILYRPKIDKIIEVGPISIAPAANTGL